MMTWKRAVAINILVLVVGATQTSQRLAEAKSDKAIPKPSPQTPVTSHPAQIDRNSVLILIRSTMLALHQANITGNYTVLRDLGAPGFQAANTAARLGEIFANERANKLDLSGVAVLEPQLTVLPEILPNGLLHMAGFFPSVPLQVNFEELFAAVDGQWRIMGITVNIGQSGPSAPTEQQAGKPASTGQSSKAIRPQAMAPAR